MNFGTSSSWLLWLRREFTLRPMLLLFVGAVIGLTFGVLQFNVVFLVFGFFLAETAPARLWLGIGFALGALLSTGPTASRPPDGAVGGQFEVRSTGSGGALLRGSIGQIWLPAQFLPDSRLVVGDTVSVAGQVNQGTFNASPSTFVVLPPSLPTLARSQLMRFWENHLGPRDASILEALTLGQTEGLSRDSREAIQRTGTAGILSTSGLQVFSLAWVCSGLLSLLPMPRGVRLSLSFLVLLIYLAATGGHAGTWRAVGVCGLAWLAPFVRREYDGLSALGLVSVMYLIFRPEAVYEPGFQYATVAMLGWCLLPGEGWVWRGFWMWLVLAPLSAALFGVVSFSSLVLGPLTFLVMPLVIIGAFLGTIIYPLFGDILLSESLNIAKLMLNVLQYLGHWKILSISLPSFSGYFLAVYYAVLVRLWHPKRRIQEEA